MGSVVCDGVENITSGTGSEGRFPLFGGWGRRNTGRSAKVKGRVKRKAGR